MNPDTSLVMTQASAMAVIVWLIEQLKRAGWCQWISDNTTKLNRILSVIAALATSSAIHAAWDPATATLTISGLTFTAIFHFFWGAAQQFIGQEMIYEFVYKPKTALKEAAQKVAQTTATVAHRASDKIVDAVEEAQP